MSLLKKSKTRKIGSAWERLRNALFAGERRGLRERKPRRLRIDPLEERVLLSVAPVNTQDMLINQTTSFAQYIDRQIGGQRRQRRLCGHLDPR